MEGESIHVSVICQEQLNPKVYTRRLQEEKKTSEGDWSIGKQVKYEILHENQAIHWPKGSNETEGDSSFVKFEVERVFPPSTPQRQIYHEIGCPILDRFMDGYNCSLLAYGTTGSGKAKTLYGKIPSEGPPIVLEEGGILPRLAKDMWQMIGQAPMIEYFVEVSFIDLFIDDLHDLLSSGQIRKLEEKPQGEGSRRGERGERGGGCFIKDLTKVRVKNVAEMMQCVNRGLQYLRESYQSESYDPRFSNTIFSIYLTQRQQCSSSSEIVLKQSELQIIHLPGIERTRKVGLSGDMLLLRKLSRLSSVLCSFSNVICALQRPENKFIPWRDSKLTRLLSNSLGKNCCVYIVFNIVTDEGEIAEARNTLRFAKLCQNVRQFPKYEEVISSSEVLPLDGAHEKEI